MQTAPVIRQESMGAHTRLVRGIIRYIYLVSVPVPDTGLLKLLTSCVMGEIEASYTRLLNSLAFHGYQECFTSNKATLVGSWMASGWGLVTRKTELHSPIFQEAGRV